MTTPTPPGQLPTRQQLDEIDALLRRMLALPSMSSEPPTAAIPAAHPASVYPAPTIRETTPPHPVVPGQPSVQSWRVEWPQASVAPAPPSVAAWGTPLAPTTPPAPWQQTSPPFANGMAGAEIPMGLPVPATATTPAQRTSRSLFVWMLIIINALCELSTHVLGPAGAWMRGSGRQFLGWVGVLMFIAAVGWALGNWYGYAWPQPNWSRLKLPQ